MRCPVIVTSFAVVAVVPVSSAVGDVPHFDVHGTWMDVCETCDISRGRATECPSASSNSLKSQVTGVAFPILSCNDLSTNP